MRIAQVSPLFESVPPKGYGGTERVISNLTEELVRLGHDVTLFASGDSVTGAELRSVVPRSIRPAPGDLSWMPYLTMHLDQVSALASTFDVIHFHTDCLHYLLARRLPVPHITTLHGRQDIPELQPFYRHFRDIPLISISNSQRSPLPDVNWVDTVYHGLPLRPENFNPEPENYFAFVGRVSREKRLDRAIEIARSCGVPLYIGAKVDKADEAYFREVIEPLLHQPGVHFLGELDEREKRALLRRAKALLFPIDWPEPFGLVMIEAFSSGTPVIAYRHGSVPEIMEDGVTGFVVDNQEQAIRAGQQIDTIDRYACRAVFERRFSSRAMAEHYLEVYRRMQRRDVKNGIDLRAGAARTARAEEDTPLTRPMENQAWLKKFSSGKTGTSLPPLLPPTNDAGY